MDTHTVLADDAYEAGLTCEEFAEILIEVGYTRGEAKRRAKQLCAESLAYPSHIFASSPRAEKSAD